MGFLDKVKGMISGNEQKIDDVVDKAADAIDEKTDGKHADKIDQVQDKVDEALGTDDK